MLMLLTIALPIALLGLMGGDTDDTAFTETNGTARDDTIAGGSGVDFIAGFAGDDDLSGGGDTDFILGHEGNDIVIGNGGSDALSGGDGDDFVMGNSGDDLIDGGTGRDFAEGDLGNDSLFGGDGEDTLLGGRNSDLVEGDAGDDILFGGILRGVPLQEDALRALASGQTLNDILQNSDLEIDLREDDFADTLNGGQGDDVLFVGNGDTAIGGQGDDTFHLTLDDDNSDIGPALIDDYDSAQDSINIVFDAPLSVDQITVETDGDDAIVVVDGEQLAVVNGAAATLTAADISVLTEDSVVGLFDPNT